MEETELRWIARLSLGMVIVVVVGVARIAGLAIIVTVGFAVVVGFSTAALVVGFATIAVVIAVRIASLCGENSGFVRCIGCSTLGFLWKNMRVVICTRICKDCLGCHVVPCLAKERNKARPVFILDVGMLKGVEKKLISFVVIVLLSVGLLCHDGSDEFLDFIDMLINAICA